MAEARKETEQAAQQIAGPFQEGATSSHARLTNDLSRSTPAVRPASGSRKARGSSRTVHGLPSP